MEFSRQGYWSGLPLPSPGDLLDPVIEPGSSFSIAGRFFMSHQGSLAIQERRTKYLFSLLPLLLSRAIWHGSGQWSISRHLLGPSEETFVFLNDTEKHILCHSSTPSSYLQFRWGGWSQSSLFVPLKEQLREGQENCIAAGPGQARTPDKPQQLLMLEFLDIWNKFCLFDTDFLNFLIYASKHS